MVRHGGRLGCGYLTKASATELEKFDGTVWSVLLEMSSLNTVFRSLRTSGNHELVSLIEVDSTPHDGEAYPALSHAGPSLYIQYTLHPPKRASLAPVAWSQSVY